MSADDDVQSTEVLLKHLEGQLNDDHKLLRTLAKQTLKQQDKLAFDEYVAAHHLNHIHGGAATDILLLIGASIVSLYRFAKGLPKVLYIMFWFFVAALLCTIMVQYVFYEPLHYVVDPTIDAVIKFVNVIIDAGTKAIDAVLKAVNTVTGGINKGIGAMRKFFHGKHHSSATIPKIRFNPKRAHIDKRRDLGRSYWDLVHMRSLCTRYKTQWAVFHIAMEAFTHNNLCLDIRNIYPSPVLRWIDAFFYAKDFANPGGANCRVTPEIGICLAWHFGDFIWLIATLLWYAFILISAYPIFHLCYTRVRCHVYLALYWMHHRKASKSDLQIALNHFADKHMRFISPTVRAKRSLKHHDKKKL